MIDDVSSMTYKSFGVFQRISGRHPLKERNTSLGHLVINTERNVKKENVLQ